MRAVPLARHLVRFSPPPAVVIATVIAPVITSRDKPPPAVAREPEVTLAVGELDARLAAAADAARADAVASADTAWAARLETAALAHRAALDAAVAEARARWVAEEAAHLAAQVEGAFATLRDTLASALAAALHPLLAEALALRATAAFVEALDQLLADPAHPLVTVAGPADLVAAVQTARGTPANLAYTVGDGCELSLHVDGARVETRLAAALATLTTEADPDV